MFEPALLRGRKLLITGGGAALGQSMAQVQGPAAKTRVPESPSDEQWPAMRKQ